MLRRMEKKLGTVGEAPPLKEPGVKPQMEQCQTSDGICFQLFGYELISNGECSVNIFATIGILLECLKSLWQ